MNVSQQQHARVATGRQFSGLDLLRFAAAMIVMFYHLALVVRATPHPLLESSASPALRPLAWPGWIGVEIFFTLSGFIISFSAQGASASSFARNRFIRLYPTAWVCATLTMLVLLATRTSPLSPNIVFRWVNTGLLFTRGPYLDPSYWTLETELRFYLLVFLLLLFRKLEALIAVMSAVGILSAGVLAASVAAQSGLFRAPAGITHLGSTPLSALLNRILLLDYGCYFALGSLLWACLLQHASLTRLVALGLCLCGCIAGIVLHAAELSLFLNTHFSTLAPMLYWIAAVVAIFLSVRFHATLTARLGRRGARLARTLGLLTYPLYLLHQEIGYCGILWLDSRLPYPVALVLMMSALIALSYIVLKFAEQPLQRWFRARLFPLGKATHMPSATLP